MRPYVQKQNIAAVPSEERVRHAAEIFLSVLRQKMLSKVQHEIAHRPGAQDVLQYRTHRTVAVVARPYQKIKQLIIPRYIIPVTRR